ncbi:MAG: hypothetical protein PW788_00600 [Micavibrio sp.]|nr:hypothetical protein [Micavibrio sp.]
MSTVTKTFMNYEELDLYDSFRINVEVASRDISPAAFSQINFGLPPTYLGFPTNFYFFDADVTTHADGTQTMGAPRNQSKEYVVADLVMSLDDYKRREEPKLKELKQQKHSRFSQAMSEFLDGGLSLTRAFKAALSPKRPILSWYIQNVESTLADAARDGVKTVSLWDRESVTTAKPVTDDMIILDKTLRQIHPPLTLVPVAAAKPSFFKSI